MSTETDSIPPLAAPVTHQPSRMKRLVLMLGVPALVLVAIAVIYLKGGHSVGTDNAYIKADKTPISSQVSGVLVEVPVHDNEWVKAGQVLFKVDPAPFEVAVHKAQAQLAQVRSDMMAARSGYGAKQAEIKVAESKYSFALKEQERLADLVKQNFISPAKFDEAKNATQLAQEQIVALRQDLQRQAQNLGGGPEAAIEKTPAYLAAKSLLEQAELDRTHAVVTAATSGIVSKPPKVGQFVTPGAMQMALVANDNLWVEANFTETDLTYVRPGQPVEIRVDTYPDVRWTGVVDSVSAATGSEFSVIPSQNATGNWVKISQRVPVRIRLNPLVNGPQLRSGLSAEVTIETGHRRSLLGLTL